MARLALLIEYDGTHYAGWQVQTNGMSVHQVLQQALQKTYDVDVVLVGAGRTDSGVHARGQVAHIVLSEGANQVPLDKIAKALNTRLPKDVRVRAAAPVHDTFHARFDAVEREYIYRMATQYDLFERHSVWAPEHPWDPQAMVDVTRSDLPFIGRHDFTTFSKFNPSTESYVCDLRELSAEYHAPYLTLRIRADRFVYGMCRLLVGGLWSVARGKTDLAELERRLNHRARHLQLGSAPAHGLYLNRVRYANGVFDDLSYF